MDFWGFAWDFQDSSDRVKIYFNDNLCLLDLFLDTEAFVLKKHKFNFTAMEVKVLNKWSKRTDIVNQIESVNYLDYCKYLKRNQNFKIN